MKCPRDQSALVAVSVLNHTVQSCEICHGLFAENSVVTALAKYKSVKIPDAGGIPFTAEFQEGTASCPHDATRMKVVEHQKVKIDLCSTCKGLWMDRGELEKILLSRTNSGSIKSDSTLQTLDVASVGIDIIAGGVDLAGEAGSAIGDFIGEAVGAIFSL